MLLPSWQLEAPKQPLSLLQQVINQCLLQSTRTHNPPYAVFAVMLQVLEVETFIPMVLQRQEDGVGRLKRVILIGDHHQLPPVVQNMAFQKYSHLDQSLFARFVRLGTPYVELNAQGRARPSIAKLYNWRYGGLQDLPNVVQVGWLVCGVHAAGMYAGRSPYRLLCMLYGLQ